MREAEPEGGWLVAKVRNRGSGSFSCVYGMFVYRMIIHERQRELDTYTGIGLFQLRIRDISFLFRVHLHMRACWCCW